MRYEVKASGVPDEVKSLIIDAPTDTDAVFRAGILVGKRLRRGKVAGSAFRGISGTRVHGAWPTDKPIVKAHDPNYRREETPA